jgi:hypothetical protein
METKKCNICSEVKSIDDFHNRKKSKDGKSPNCKLCATNHNKKDYYEKHKEKHNRRIVERRRTKKLDYDRYIHSLGLKCIKCGLNHPAILDFHHRDPSTKEDTISNLKWTGCALETLQREIDKCDVLCANCHRILHYNQRNS